MSGCATDKRIKHPHYLCHKLGGQRDDYQFQFHAGLFGQDQSTASANHWPQAGAQLSGTNFAVIGWVADPTVAITTQLVLTNGSGTNMCVYTNTYTGEVDRNGNFWLENLPLQPGSNAFAIAVEDAVGNTSLTNLSVVQSSLVLTISPVTPDSQLWQPTVNVTGTISDPTYAVWVNGVKGHNNGNGTWLANNVPSGRRRNGQLYSLGLCAHRTTARRFIWKLEGQPMKIHLILIALILGGEWARGTIQTSLNQDKPPYVTVQNFNITINGSSSYSINGYEEAQQWGGSLAGGSTSGGGSWAWQVDENPYNVPYEWGENYSWSWNNLNNYIETDSIWDTSSSWIPNQHQQWVSLHS